MTYILSWRGEKENTDPVKHHAGVSVPYTLCDFVFDSVETEYYIIDNRC